MLVRILWLFMVLLPTNALWAQPALEVFVSGSFRSSMVEIVPQFEKSTGIRVNVSSGPASGTTATSLATRLREGKKFDAVILAGSSGVEELVNEGLIRLAASTPLARTFLGVAVRAGMPKPDLRSVDGFRKALLSAKRIAVANGSPGVHMRERVLPGLGISDQVLPKMTAGGSALLEQGEADLQVALLGEILLMPGVDFAGRVPEEFQLVSDCLGAVAEGTSQMQAAERLIAFVASREVQPILERHGLLPVGSH